jgi:hypothetical protein
MRFKAKKLKKWSEKFPDYDALEYDSDGLNTSERAKEAARTRSPVLLPQSISQNLLSENLLEGAYQSEEPVIMSIEEQDDIYLREVTDELVRVQTFYSKTLVKLQGQCAGLQDQTYHAEAEAAIDGEEPGIPTQLESTDLLTCKFGDLYMQLLHLRSYCMSNHMGFVKILQKRTEHDLMQDDEELVASYSFDEATELSRVVAELEEFVADHFCEGSVAAARSMLTKQGRQAK